MQDDSGHGNIALESFDFENMTTCDFYILWAELLYRQKNLVRSGCHFEPQPGNIPENALECVLLAQAELGFSTTQFSLENQKCMEELKRVLSALPAYAAMNSGALAQLSLYDLNNWSKQMEFGLCELQCLRVESGLAELEDALGKAEKQGETGDFLRLLSAVPAYGSVMKLVSAVTGESCWNT
jgi:hypothetical protein